MRWLLFFLLLPCIPVALASRALSQPLPQAAQQPQSKREANLLGPSSGTEIGNGVFERKCVSCHENPVAGSRAPNVSALRLMTPEAIYAALTTGVMAPVVGNTLSEDEKRRVSETVSGRLLGSTGTGDANRMPNHCASNPSVTDPSASPAWNGWGSDMENTRFQTAKAAGLTPDQVPQLKLKWAFGFPAGLSTYGQPTIVSGRVFIASDNGYVYSLDANTGCVYWSFEAKAAMRNAISVGPVQGHGAARYAVYFGDLKANVYALDARSGNLLWTRRVEDQSTARIAGAPKLSAGRLFVPVSSFEEFAASNLDYPCCTFRGSVVALDANTGKQLWKAYSIPGPLRPVGKNSKGTQLWAPAGGSVWNSPTVDVKLHALYFGTGDAETTPAPKTSDSVMAVDMKTGKTLWSFQGTANDSFLGGCDEGTPDRSENCPPHQGPDWDFGSSPMLRTLPSGRRILVAGQKSGIVFAFDPDRNGALVWKTSVLGANEKPPSSFGAIVYGGAIDERNVYFPLRSGSMIALGLQTGKRAWLTPLSAANSGPGDAVIQSAAVTGIPGAVFVGGWDGMLQALSTVDGRIIWQFNTAQTFKTVNGVAAKGGAMGSAGPTIAGGMLFVGSGYAVFSGDQAGNVLLAFSVE
jgi:polyvinyl alcohol dehydrogenase (cytochrome)